MTLSGAHFDESGNELVPKKKLDWRWVFVLVSIALIAGWVVNEIATNNRSDRQALLAEFVHKVCLNQQVNRESINNLAESNAKGWTYASQTRRRSAEASLEAGNTHQARIDIHGATLYEGLSTEITAQIKPKIKCEPVPIRSRDASP